MKLSHVFLLLLVVVIWGLNFVFVKVGLNEIPPMLLCFTRFFLVSIPAIFFFKRPSVPFKWILFYSLVMFVLQFSLMFSGMRAGISAGLGSILLQIQVFFSIFFAAFLLKEKLNIWQILGSLISFSGIAFVGFHLDQPNVTLLGFLLILAAAAAWGFGSVIVKNMGKTPSSSLLVWGSMIAWPPLLLLSLMFEDSSSIIQNAHHLSIPSYGAIFFIAFGSTAFGFGVWNRLIQIYPLGSVAPFTLLVPIFGMLSSSLLLEESLDSWKIGAGILVVSGLILNILGTRILAKRASKETSSIQLSESSNPSCPSFETRKK